MTQFFAILSCVFLIAACTTSPGAVGNDAYATVALGDKSEAVAGAYCKAYGKVPQLRDQDPMHGIVTYDCIVSPIPLNRTAMVRYVIQ
ncbi:MAG TPA: hypothetical protein VNH44_11175 [Micropepsaceae bacterium]|nr:hypothetical protein [Micropepsaceae bacterium]